MITLPLEDDKVLVVDSDWDSGRHRSINIGETSSDWSYHKSLDKLLTKEQIRGLEAIIAVTVESYIKENKKC